MTEQWKWHEDAENGCHYVMDGNNEVCVVYTGNEAHCRLIAAAPKMLGALKETVLQLQYLADKFGETGTGAAVLSRVRAAIVQAEGSLQ